jgi:signal transduction histidine kinase
VRGGLGHGARTALAEERGITLALHGKGQVRGDRLMLRRALGNLLSNALRHTPRGATIAVTVADTAGATEVTVRNPGPPIPADALPHLFERFFRAERSRTRGDADGAGLGLAITRAIMLAHGGTLCVASGPAATCFTLRFGA